MIKYVTEEAPSSSGLGHEIFILVTWVRIPVGSLKIFWAHSSMVEQHPFKVMVEGSNPSGLTELSNYSMRDRLMVGHGPLEAGILVRIQVPQQL